MIGSRGLRRLLAAFLSGLFLAGLSACGSEPGGDGPAPADLVIRGGPIHTGAGAIAETVAVREGRVAAVGDRADIDALIGPHTDLVDLQGAALYPGFVDSHAHLLGIGMRELTLNLEGVGSVDELVDIIAAEVGASEPGALVFGRGWIETGWPENRFPSRDDLDTVSPDNPVLLIRADGHALLANSAAMAAAGVDETTADPAGGRIEKDPDGRPTGIFIDAAMALFSSLEEAPSAARKEEAYRAGTRIYAAYGWTGLHNMSVAPDDVAMIERLAARGDIPIRVYNALDAKGLEGLAREAPRTDETGRVITRAIKFYIDGALGSRGAALFEPYADRPGTRGLLLISESEAHEILTRALRGGVQVSAHAIGDRGARLALDWFEAAFAAVPENERAIREPRWRIEHAQILHPADIPRFAELGVIASMQPSHAIGDLFFAPARLGPDRLDGAYAWRSLMDAGATVAGGSDAPVERGDPLIEFYAAVARRALDGRQGTDWRPEEAVSRGEALAMFTRAPAYASFQEDALGVIAPGRRADFTVFSKDIMTVPQEEILTARAVMTVVDGRIVWRAQ